MPYQPGQQVTPAEAQGLTGQGYKLAGPDSTGRYSIISTPVGGGADDPIKKTLIVSDKTTSDKTTDKDVTSRSLTPAGQKAYQDYLDAITGGRAKQTDVTAGAIADLRGSLMPIETNPGYSADEVAQLQLTPDQEQAYITESGRPIAGAATRAEQNLMRYTSAAGYNPGLNATVERIQQEQGRQAADAIIQSRMGLIEKRQEAARNIADARIKQQEFGIEQKGKIAEQERMREYGLLNTGSSLLTQFPEYTTIGDQETKRETTSKDIDQTVNDPNARDTSLMPVVTPSPVTTPRKPKNLYGWGG